jgi:plastocyanin domain-containing protein
MSPDQIGVTLTGLGMIGYIVWFFWLKPAKGVRATRTGIGYQEAMILVKGGYTPDVIIVERGKPVRLNFRREETAACSERVIFPEFNKNVLLPEGQVVPVEFLPERSGEYEFACQMGMLRGKLIVE